MGLVKTNNFSLITVYSPEYITVEKRPYFNRFKPINYIINARVFGAFRISLSKKKAQNPLAKLATID